ncbi:MAG: hypothetical protein JXO44_14775 [Clostridia bacterium]|nr:hypothetical protein [Clostridia bacterium]
MNIVIAFSCILFFHQLYVTMNNRKLYKNGGDIIEVYRQKSFLRKTLMVIMMLAVSFTLWAFGVMGRSAVVCLPMLAYAVLMFLNHSNKVEFLELGLYLNGRFFSWETIDQIENQGPTSLKLQLHGDQYKIYVIENIEDVDRFKSAVLTRIKYTRKKK